LLSGAAGGGLAARPAGDSDRSPDEAGADAMEAETVASAEASAGEAGVGLQQRLRVCLPP